MYVVKQQENEVIYYIIVKYIKKLRKKKQNTNKHKILYKKMTKNKEINVNIQCFFLLINHVKSGFGRTDIPEKRIQNIIVANDICI